MCVCGTDVEVVRLCGIATFCAVRRALCSLKVPRGSRPARADWRSRMHGEATGSHPAVTTNHR